MASLGPSRHNRVRAALAAAAIQCGLAGVVIWGLAARGGPAPERREGIVAVNIAPLPTPSPSPSPRREPEGGAAPPAARALPAPRVAPSPRVVLATPTAAAPRGAADAGAGSGAGGQGSGTGSGRGGTGSGSGIGEPAVRVAGALSDRDYPRNTRGAAGTVAIAFRVRADGRVDRCRPIASSGSRLLDDLTCGLVERRFRYRPARDASGRPVDSELRTSFTWGQRAR